MYIHSLLITQQMWQLVVSYTVSILLHRFLQKSVNCRFHNLTANELMIICFSPCTCHFGWFYYVVCHLWLACSDDMNLTSRLEVTHTGVGLAWSYFYGYLNIVLPGNWHLSLFIACLVLELLILVWSFVNVTFVLFFSLRDFFHMHLNLLCIFRNTAAISLLKYDHGLLSYVLELNMFLIAHTW